MGDRDGSESLSGSQLEIGSESEEGGFHEVVVVWLTI